MEHIPSLGNLNGVLGANDTDSAFWYATRLGGTTVPNGLRLSSVTVSLLQDATEGNVR